MRHIQGDTIHWLSIFTSECQPLTRRDKANSNPRIHVSNSEMSQFPTVFRIVGIDVFLLVVSCFRMWFFRMFFLPVLETISKYAHPQTVHPGISVHGKEKQQAGIDVRYIASGRGRIHVPRQKTRLADESSWKGRQAARR